MNEGSDESIRPVGDTGCRANGERRTQRVGLSLVRSSVKMKFEFELNFQFFSWMASNASSLNPRFDCQNLVSLINACKIQFGLILSPHIHSAALVFGSVTAFSKSGCVQYSQGCTCGNRSFSGQRALAGAKCSKVYAPVFCFVCSVGAHDLAIQF